MEPCNSKAHVTTCARPELKHLDCPITDIRLVRKADYNAQDHASYDIADAPEDLDWYLLQSRTAEDFLPLATFHLSEFEPCSLDDSFTSDHAGTENHGRTRDPYFDRCPLQPLESQLTSRYRSASDTITANEAEWLDQPEINAFDTINGLPNSKNSEDYKRRKEQNELQIWQSSGETWA